MTTASSCSDPTASSSRDAVESEIEALIDGDLSKQLAKSPDLGRAKRIDGVHDRYIEFAKRTLPRALSLDGLRVVVDCANGAAYRVVPEALWELGADVVLDRGRARRLQHQPRLRLDRAGRDLRQGASEMRADIGIALDGDADRVIIIRRARPYGRRRPAARGHRRELAGGRPAHQARGCRDRDVESRTRALSRRRRHRLIRTPVGDRYVLEQMREHGYNVGGEQSGHIILSDYSTTGDGFVAALQVLAVVDAGQPVSEVCHRFEPLPQILKNVRIAAASRWRAPRCAPPSRTRRSASTARPADRAAVRHRAGDPGDGRGGRQGFGRGGRRRYRRCPESRHRLIVEQQR